MTFFARKTLIDAVLYTFLPKISFVASLLILPFISPYLTLADYGIYGLLMSYVGVFQMLIGLGQVVVLQNTFFTYKSKHKLIWRRSYALMIIAAVISSIILCLIIKFTLADLLGKNFLLITIMLSIYLIFTPLESLIVNYYTLREKALPYAYTMGIIGVITTSITLITIKYFNLGYLGWVISLPSTVLLTNIFFFKKFFIQERLYPEFRFNRRFLYKSLKVGLPLTPHQLSLYILGISDRLLLEYFKVPIKQIGLYNQGYNIGSQGNIVVNGIFQAFFKKNTRGF